MILQAAVNKWAATCPKTIACLTMLHRNGVRVAVFSSRLAHLSAESIGIDPGFEPKDTDLILPKEDFALAAKLLRAKPKTLILSSFTGDGHALKMPVKEILYIADTEMQLIQPLAPLTDGKVLYRTAYTAQAAAVRQFYETEQGIIPFTDFADALYFYGILQRNKNGKDDRRNVSFMKSVASINSIYGKLRGAEMNIDSRVTTYLKGINPAKLTSTSLPRVKTFKNLAQKVLADSRFI